MMDELVPQGTEAIDWSQEPDGPVLLPWGTGLFDDEAPPVVGIVAMAVKGAGRPYAFTEELQEQYLERLAAGDGRVLAARNVGVSPQTVMAHRKRFPEFEALMHEAEQAANQLVVNALFMNATVNMNPTAQIFWLKNRLPDEWKDRREPAMLQQINGGPSVEWTLNEARAEAHAVLDEIAAKRAEKEAQAIEAESREADGG